MIINWRSLGLFILFATVGVLMGGFIHWAIAGIVWEIIAQVLVGAAWGLLLYKIDGATLW